MGSNNSLLVEGDYVVVANVEVGINHIPKFGLTADEAHTGSSLQTSCRHPRQPWHANISYLFSCDLHKRFR